MSSSSPPLSPTTQANLTQDALTNTASVFLVKLPLMASDAECFDHDIDAPDDEPPSKRKKIAPYKLKETDKKMIYESGTVIYTEEFKRSVWDYLLSHSLAQGELRYPEISHSVLYKWRRKALEEKGAFVPQRHVESRKSLLADMRRDRDEDDEDSDEPHRRYSEPPKVPKLKISLKMNKEVPRPKMIPALTDDMPVDKKVRVVTFALQNSTQKAADFFNMRAGTIHSFLSQNVIRRMALDRIRNKVTKGFKNGDRTSEEIEEIVNLAKRTNVERAARTYSVKEGQVLQWMRSGVPSRNAIEYNGVMNGKEPKERDYGIEFQMKVLDLARKQSLTRACKIFQVQPTLVQEWMRKIYSENEIPKAVAIEPEPKTRREENNNNNNNNSNKAPVNADELETLLYERLQQPSSRIRALDTGGMDMETVVSILKIALVSGSKVASLKFNIPRTTIATWITRNSLEELTKATRQPAETEKMETRRLSGSPPQNTAIITNGLNPHSPIKNIRETRSVYTPKPKCPSPVRIPLPVVVANGDQMEMDEFIDGNNNSTLPEKQEMVVVEKPLMNGVTTPSEERKSDGKSVSFSVEQIEKALELGISMKCLLRWLECREHFMKLRKSRLDSAGGDCLRELLTFRLEAVDYAQKESRVFAASVFRVTLTELNEWSKRREAYMKVLLNAPCDNSMALEVVDTDSVFLDAEQRTRAQSIANRLGIDLSVTNQFIQQLYASF